MKVKSLTKEDYLNILRYFRGRVKEIQATIDEYDAMSSALFNERIQLDEMVKSLEKTVVEMLRDDVRKEVKKVDKKSK